MRPLSYSQISTYESCPLSYKLQYIDRLEPKAKWYFSFGDTLHKCAEYFFKAKLPSYPSLEELLSFYDDNWKSEGWESIEDETSQMAHGEQILRDFWDINGRDFKVPLATEKAFIVDIKGVKLRGYIDRLDKLATGGLDIVDYKSNQELFTRDYVENFFQLTLYQLACERMWNMPVEKLTLYHLRSNTPVSCEPRSREKLDEASGIVVSVAKNIAAERFPAIENQYCPYYKHKYGKPLPERKLPEQLRNIAIADVVERYITLQDEQRLREGELNELKDLIIQYCKAEGLNRVFGREHAITYKVIERMGYDENKVRAILEPAGLWDRVLKFDPAMMKALVESSGMPKDVKEKIASLVKVVSSYPQLWTKRFKEDSEE